MRRQVRTLAMITAACLCPILFQEAVAQGYDPPLTIQGVNRTVQQSAASHAVGGITIGVKNDIAIMFGNPALLRSDDGIRVSLGGVYQSTGTKQDQVYGGLQGHSAFNLLTMGVTGAIRNPDSIRGTATGSDTVQRPFDAIPPQWNHNRSATRPMQVFIAAPFTIENVPFVVGAGFVQYANLDRFYGNNNCFSPSVLSVLDGTISTTPLATTPYLTQWYQYYQQREGSINGYGIALSAMPMERVSVGVSAMLLNGSSDDLEVRVARGQMAFYNNWLRLSKNGMMSYTKTGTSDFKGSELTVGAKYEGKNFEFGVSVKPPTTITRTFSSTMVKDSVTTLSRLNHRVDSLHAYTTTASSGEDKMKFPWRGTLGLSIKVRQNLTVGVEYELRALASAVYTSASGVESKPWLSASLWHVGVEFLPNDWLALRAGVREDAEAYEPIAEAIRGEAVKYAVYSLGAGIACAGVRLNVAYEYSDMKYIDTWSNAASINREFRQGLIADVSYAIPW
jgi:hypothetical protein